jgi:molecular chaperone DnaJ
MAKDYYQILGLSRGASADDVKKAYRKLSKELHPDRNPGNAEAERKFKEVNQAYEVLSNPQKKQSYDQFGEAGANAGAGGFGGFDFSGFSGGQAFDMSDLFESFFGGRGGRAERAREEQKGEDREVMVDIDLADVVNGKRLTVNMRRLRPCDRCTGNGAEPGSSLVSCGECGGTGQVTKTARSLFGVVQQTAICPRCSGSGKVPEKACTKCSGEGRRAEDAAITVDVPAGIDDGQTLRLRGEGDAGRRGAAAGDLYVHVRVRADSRFMREGVDIRSVLSILVVDAILGTEISVDTVHGPVSLNIPDGTQPGQIMRIKGKGLPELNSRHVGDHYVTVNVEVPKKLSRAERKIVEEWRQARE